MSHRDLGPTALCLFLAMATPGAMPSSRASDPPAVLGRHRDGEGAQGLLRVRLSWGHRSAAGTASRINLLMADGTIEDVGTRGLEDGDAAQAGMIQTRAGGGDVDGIDFSLRYRDIPVTPISSPHVIWSYLLEKGDADAARRLRLDPGYRPDVRKLTVVMDRQGTKGFSVTIDQLLTIKSFWVPELDVYLTAGEQPVSFQDHQKELATWSGRRVLEQVDREPESSYEEFTKLWEDMGGAGYRNPAEVPPGHIVCVAWDSATFKFGIDRGAGVRSDLGSPDQFKLTFDMGEQSLKPGGSCKQQKQRLTGGLPVLVTDLECGGTRCEIEQFAYPLDGPTVRRNGGIPMALLQKVKLTELQGKARTISIRMNLQVDPATLPELAVYTEQGAWVCEDPRTKDVRLAIAGPNLSVRSRSVPGDKARTHVIEVVAPLPAGGIHEFTIKLPSPVLPASKRKKLLELDHASARAATLRYWSDALDRGARFEVPEASVNELFRANLWHALRLPRRHGSDADHPTIDLPYSNFAYGQKGTPWPINQAVYVDYMLYDLRGYHDLAREELAAIYRNNQEPDGHVGGYANWGVYTPGMMYAVAQHYLLTRDRAALESLLPQTLKALDWCLAHSIRAEPGSGSAQGLMLAPLNDLTKDARVWAFNQAYLFAGLDLLARVLSDIRHPRAEECRSAARAVGQAIELRFGKSATEAPLVQLRDQSWIPYVPSDALTPRRLMEVWYPTDVDTGALHLSRLKAISPNGALTAYLLHDHEDNLFFRGWGMANEPVYNQQATAYLLREEVKPAIRAFYSMMACAFSHSVFEPVEHRWGWGQYFGPPSTDGAWFELYRRMLIHERDDDTLLLLQATPRRWLGDGKKIEIARAPTYYGPLAMSVISHSGSGEILARVELAARTSPRALLVRLRHPQGKMIKAVTVDGREWTDFDARREWVRIGDPIPGKYEIVARY